MSASSGMKRLPRPAAGLWPLARRLVWQEGRHGILRGFVPGLLWGAAGGCVHWPWWIILSCTA